MKKFDVVYYGAFMFWLGAECLEDAKEKARASIVQVVEGSVNFSRLEVFEGKG